MACLFDIKLIGKSGPAYWFVAKDKYEIRIDTEKKRSSCSCRASVFKISGRKQRDCKHVKKAWQLLKVVGRA